MSVSSGVFSSTGQVVTGGSGPNLYGIIFVSDNVHASTITLYRGTGAVSGMEVWQASFPAGVSPQQNVIFKHPISCAGNNSNGGIYAVITGTGGGGVVTYDGGG